MYAPPTLTLLCCDSLACCSLQFDTLVGDLTVSEMLMYTAELKRPRSEPHQHKAEAVAQLIDRLVSAGVNDE